MKRDDERTPWLLGEGTDECQPLLGNRAGFEALGDAIRRLLDSDEDSVSVDPPSLGFSSLELRDRFPDCEPSDWRSTLAVVGCLSLVGATLVLAVVGLVSVINQFLN